MTPDQPTAPTSPSDALVCSTAAQGFVWDYSDADYPEDAAQENGNYGNQCLRCDGSFIGHKNRTICNKCETQINDEWNAMTPEERRDAEESTKLAIATALARFRQSNA